MVHNVVNPNWNIYLLAEETPVYSPHVYNITVSVKILMVLLVFINSDLAWIIIWQTLPVFSAEKREKSFPKWWNMMVRNVKIIRSLSLSLSLSFLTSRITGSRLTSHWYLQGDYQLVPVIVNLLNNSYFTNIIHMYIIS